MPPSWPQGSDGLGRCLPKKRRPRLPGALLLLLLFFSLPAAVGIGSAEPGVVGEKLYFQIRWGVILAGSAELSRLPNETLAGVECAHFQLTARTLTIVELFYKLRQQIDSYTDLGVERSLLYKKQEESRNPRDLIVRFDWLRNQAQYTNFGEPLDPIPIPPGTLDPLAIIYYLRRQPLGSQAEFQRPVTDGKENVLGRAKYLGEETISIAGRSYHTYVFEPDLQQVKGVFEKSPGAKMTIWLTTDERHLLVKLKSKIIVGSFVAELLGYE